MLSTANSYNLLQRKIVNATKATAVLEVVFLTTAILAPFLYSVPSLEAESNPWPTLPCRFLCLISCMILIYGLLWASSALILVICTQWPEFNEYISDNCILIFSAINVGLAFAAAILQTTSLITKANELTYMFWCIYIPVWTWVCYLLLVQFLGPWGGLLSLVIILAGSYGVIPSLHRNASTIILIAHALIVVVFTLYIGIMEQNIYIFYDCNLSNRK